MGTVLLVTNDYPPRRGGIESFVFSLCQALPAADLVVYTARMAGSERVDRDVSYPVVRDRSRMLVPSPRVQRDVRRAFVEHGCDRVVFGASAPLGLLGGPLRAAGARRVVAISHGHEVWWSKTPVARRLLRRIGHDSDVVTYVSDFCQAEIARALFPADAGAMVRMSPGVDAEMFRPGLDAGPLRRRLGLGDDQPVVLSASRLVARKGHDMMLQAWPRVLDQHPGAALVIVGDGPRRRRLERRVAASAALRASVRFVTDATWHDMPGVYAAADLLAVPCRTRLGGLEPEALGIVFLEAAACGLPVVVGASGGAPETVVDGETGYVVDPRSVSDVADRVCALLSDPDAAAAMGRRGREFVMRAYSPAAANATLRALLALRP